VIARIWRGWAPQARAGDYQRHYKSEVSGHLRAVSGFRGADLLRRDEGAEVMFTSITWFTDLGAVRDFAGDDYEQAVVEDAARARSAVGTNGSLTTKRPSGCSSGRSPAVQASQLSTTEVAIRIRHPGR
jgi:heme-degrading monooxygenase HmoA